VYGIKLTRYNPTVAEVETAISVFPIYGLSLDSAMLPGEPLFESLMTHALIYPLDVFALAASHGLEELAKSSSTYLLSFALSEISEEQAEKIGAAYLRRLFFLHLGRIEALKRLLVQPPSLHGPTKKCGFAQQGEVSRAWALASAYISWGSRPGQFNLPKVSNNL
jgi:hypothetical protein